LPSDAAPLLLSQIFDFHDPSRDAVVCAGERRSFGWLDTESARLAGWLASLGTGYGDFVAFTLPNGTDFFALTFAIYRCGAVPVPLSPKLTERERNEILELLAPRLCVDQDDLPAAHVEFLSLGGISRPSPHWKACLSGGSSGRPKVIVDARPAAFAPDMQFVDIPAASCVLVPGPFYHNATFACSIFALWRGSTVVTMPRFDAAQSLDLIAAEQVTWALMVPTMMNRILDLPSERRDGIDLSSWKQVVHTAAPMAPATKHAWIRWLGPDHIWEVYGATEGLVRCWIGGREWLERPGSVGRPLGGARLRILDDKGDDLPPFATGEVFAMPPGGPCSTYRYIGAERKAASDGWESIGDAGWLDDNGYLYLADRKDDMIISGGVNIWPAEVEAALLEHPEIHSCAVFGMHDRDLGAKVHAVIETRADLTLTLLGQFLAERLVRPKHPRSIELQDHPVRDDAGKFRKPRMKASQ